MSAIPEVTGDYESPWPDETLVANERRVLILAPTGNDARFTAQFLEASGMNAVVVATLHELMAAMRAGCGAALVAQEVITNRTAPLLFGALKRQPAWSDVPVTLITTGGLEGDERMRRLTAFEPNSNITVLERPFRPATLVSTVEVALRSRQRQYEVRKLLVEINEAREAAERASRAKDEFLAALSHELRTPLNPVLLLASEAASDPALPAEVRDDFEQIARNIMLEARLIDDLLDLTRITQGKISLDLQPLDAHAALNAALATTRPEIEEKQLSLELDLRAPSRGIQADPVRLQQILWNVLKNAAKFTPAGGRIRVETLVNGNAFVIRISDTGVGMDPWEISRVFDAFVQGSHARKGSGHRFGGLGLGLAISRRLVELHGGTIQAASDGAGKGSMFTINLPLAVDGPSRLAAAVSSQRPARVRALPKRLLVVEDHPATRASLTKLLERRGYQVAAAGSLAEARALAATADFDAILSDVGLPDGDGYELMRELAGLYGVPGIALTGYGMESDVMQSKSAGFVAHLTKPISVHALDAALETLG